MSPLQNGDMDVPEAPDQGVSKIVDDNSPSDSNGVAAEPIQKHDPFKTISNNLLVGKAQIQQQYYNIDAINNPNLSDDQVRQAMASGPLSKTADVETSYQGEPWYVRGASDASSMEPGLEDMLKQGGIGWGAGVAADVVAAPAYAAATATGIGAPIAAVIGATLPAVGWTMGAANAAWHQSAGELAGDLMQNPEMIKNGVSRDTIKNVAYSVGAVNAGLSIIGVTKLMKLSGRTLSAVETGWVTKMLTHEAVQKVASNQAGRIGIRYAGSVVEQSSIAASNTFLDHMAKTVIALIQHKPADTYGSLPETFKATMDTFLHALSGTSILTAGAMAAGAVGGTAKAGGKILTGKGKEFVQNTTGKTSTELLAHVRTSLEESKLEPGKLEINEQGQVAFHEHTEATGEENPLDTLFGHIEQAFTETPEETPSITSGKPGTYRMYRGGKENSIGATNNLTEGTFTAEDKEYAKEYEDASPGNVTQEVHVTVHKSLNLQNESDLMVLGKIWQEADPGPTKGMTSESLSNQFRKGVSSVPPNVVKSLIAHGYDTIISSNDFGVPDSGPVALSLKPGNLKFIPPGQTAELAPPEPTGRTIGPKDHTQELTAILTQARRDQIDHDLGLLDRETRTINTETSRREKSGLPPKQLTIKLERIQHTREALQHESHMLESGLLTVPEEGGVYGRVKLKVLDRIFKSLVKESVEAEKAGRQNVSILQDKLEQVVRAVTPDKTLRAQARQFINGVTTQKQFQAAAKKIHENVVRWEEAKMDVENREQAAVTFDKVKNLLKGNAVRLASGKPISGLPPEITASLQQLRAFLKDGKTADAAIDEFNTKHKAELDNREWDKIPVDDIQKFNLATMAGRLLHGSAETRTHAAAELTDMIQNGKEQIQAQRDAAQVEKEKLVSAAHAAIGVKQSGPRSGAKANRAGISKIKTVKAGFKQWVDFIDFLMPKDKNKEFRIGNLDPTESQHNYTVKKNESAKVLNASLHAALEKDGLHMSQGELLKRVYDGNNHSYNVSYNDAAGKSVTIKLTKNEMIDIWLKAHNQNEHVNLEKGNGYTLEGHNSTLDVIGGFLDSKDKALAQGLLDFYEYKYTNDVNPYYRAKANIDLPKQDNYTPSPKEHQSAKLTGEPQNTKVSSQLPSSSKSKTVNANAIQIQDAFGAADRYSNDWDHKITHDKYLTNLNDVYNDPDIQNHIRDNFGAGALQIYKNGVDRFVRNDPMNQKDSTGILSAIRGNISMHTLGFRWVTSTVTHLSSITAALADDSPADTLKSVVQSVANPLQTAKTMKAIWDSPIITARRKEGPAVDLQNMIHGQQTLGHEFVGLGEDSPSAYAAFNRMAFAGISYGDSGKAVIAGNLIYNTAIRNGMSHKEAIIEVERRMEQTQQGTGPGALPDYYAQHPLVHTTLGMFQNEHTQLTGALDHAFNEFGNSDRGPNAVATLAHKTVMVALIPALAAGLQHNATMLTSDDKKKREQGAYGVAGSAVAQPFMGYSIINSAVQRLWLLGSESAIGQDQSKAAMSLNDSNILVSTYLDNIVKAGLSIRDAATQKKTSFLSLGLGQAKPKEDKTAKAIYQTGNAVGGLLGVPSAFTGIPVDTAVGLEKKDPLGAMYSALGMPHGEVMRREQKAPTQSLEQSLYGPKKPQGALTPAFNFMDSYIRGGKPPEKTNPTDAFINSFTKDE